MVQFFRYSAVVALAFVVVWGLAKIYDLSLRDPRFFDGWLLLAIMFLQMVFHFRDVIPAAKFVSETRWTQVHILVGYVAIGAFIVHCGAEFPDSLFEWLLWGLFVLVALTGIVGSYFMASIPLKLEHHSQPVEFDAIDAIRSHLSRRTELLVATSEDEESLQTIWELYATTLRKFFNKPRNLLAHLTGSQLPTRRIYHEIDASALSVDEPSRKILQSIKALVAEKDNLDFQYAHRGLLRLWTFVHVPATYALTVLTVLHIAIVYAFSSGVP